MKRFMLLIAALCVPLVLAGCDAAGTDTASPTARVHASGLTSADSPASARPVRVTTDIRHGTDVLAATEPVTDPGDMPDTQATTSPDGQFTFTPVDNPQPITEDVPGSQVQEVFGGGATTNGPPPPCEPDNPSQSPDCGGVGPPPGGGGTTSVYTHSFSRIPIYWPDAVSMESHSYARTGMSSTSPLVNIPYIAVIGRSYANGAFLFSKSASANNGAYAIVQQYVQKNTPGSVAWEQRGTHTFNVGSSTITDYSLSTTTL